MALTISGPSNILSSQPTAGPSSREIGDTGALNVSSTSPQHVSTTPKQTSLLFPYNERAALRYPSPPGPPHPSAKAQPRYQAVSPYPTQTLYHFQNPETGDVVSTHLPPDHPAMICLQEGHHIPGPTYWGIVGLLSAIVFFPVGMLCCLIDREVYCTRCGEMIHSGLST
ncbi:uncharacterized protein EI90DRAFT_3069485 [Cantharellus anzutake]|uniref:uncharacterized protein n=1 Tax=Cantharellus anzutake TaxID=1750568 RepID=UPI001903E216|nr:uncharacterized protein EI90DRAFT_3069485 [Cantharellus anzutake]KAF8326516.1 hypothetical protein EI90DRAFT_3069485 [Cantharellus anzutake]